MQQRPLGAVKPPKEQSPLDTKSVQTFQQGQGILQRSRQLVSQPFSFSLKSNLALILSQARGQQNQGLGLACNSDLIFWILLPRTSSRSGKNRRLEEEMTVIRLPLDETDSRPHIWTMATAFQLPSLLSCLSLPRTFLATPRKFSSPTCYFGQQGYSQGSTEPQGKPYYTAFPPTSTSCILNYDYFS